MATTGGKVPSRRPHNLRQPISCIPCRTRKLKCSRGGTPCETCIKRGIADTCTYQKSAIPTTSPQYRVSTAIVPPLESRLPTPAASTEDCSSPEHATASIDTRISSSQAAHHVDLDAMLSDQLSPRRRLTSNQPAGVLLTSKSGHVRYVPANSKLHDSEAQQPDTEEEDDVIAFPLAISASAKDELMNGLPPLRQCTYLKDTTFRVFSPLFHVLYDPIFQESYSKFQCDPASASLSWIALLYVILSLGVLSLDADDSLLFELGDQGPIGDVRRISKHYRAMAMKCLAADGMMWRHDLRTLQALVLLIYSMNHSQTRSSTWALLGTTYNIALAMGCHVDPKYLGLGLVESEERRRIWAGLCMLYTISNASLQNLDVRSLPQEVDLPRDVDDMDLLYGKTSKSPSRPTQMSYVLYKFQLYKLSARISSLILSRKTPSPTQVSEIEQLILADQNKWDSRYHLDNISDKLPVHHQVQLYILYGYSHQLLLLLHRPLLRAAASDHMVHERCVTSALELLQIHQVLFQSPEYKPYQWYTYGLCSFYAFHGAFLLATFLTDAALVNYHIHIREPLKLAIQRFEATKWRSPICENAARVLTQITQFIPTTGTLTPLLPLSRHSATPLPSPSAHASAMVVDEFSLSDPVLSDFGNLPSADAFELFSANYWLAP